MEIQHNTILYLAVVSSSFLYRTDLALEIESLNEATGNYDENGLTKAMWCQIV